MLSNIQNICEEDVEFSRQVTRIGRVRAMTWHSDQRFHDFSQFYRCILNNESSLCLSPFNSQVSPKVTPHLPLTFSTSYFVVIILLMMSFLKILRVCVDKTANVLKWYTISKARVCSTNLNLSKTKHVFRRVRKITKRCC